MVKYIPTSKDDALNFLASHDAYIVAGGTDMMVLKEMQQDYFQNSIKMFYISQI